MKKIIILFLVFPFVVFGQKKILQNGDLIFQNLDCGPMCEAINAVTQGYEGKDFNHMGMVVLEQENYFILESLGKGVRKVALSDFLTYTKQPMYVGRLKEEYQNIIPDAIQFAYKQIGLPYDHDFIYDNGKYYCSELIYDAFLYANNEVPFFQLYPMTYKQPNKKDFFEVWVTHFKQQKMDVPEGKLGCNPGGMSLDGKLDMFSLQQFLQ